MPSKRVALIQGASRGIGLALTRRLLAEGWRVVATCRAPEAAPDLHALGNVDDALRILRLDVTREESIAAAARSLSAREERLHLLMNVAGVLHDGELGPEKKLTQVDPQVLARVFEVNAFGPLLVAKHFERFLRHDEAAVLANLSARVGSIGDNRLGGWYAYRASKAAQNMFTKNLSIELGRRAKHLAVIALHPGTVATDLSAPFTGRLPPDKLFDADRAAMQLLAIAHRVTPEDSGKFFAWDGQEIPW